MNIQEVVMIIFGGFASSMIGYLFWQIKKNQSDIHDIDVEFAVIKKQIEKAVEDHDTLMLLKDKVHREFIAAWKRIDARKSEIDLIRKVLSERTHKIGNWVAAIKGKLQTSKELPIKFPDEQWTFKG